MGDESETYDHPHADGGRRRGSDALFAAGAIGRNEYSMPCPILLSKATDSAADFNAAFNGLPVEKREGLRAQAEDELRRQNPTFWFNAKGTRAGEKLIQQELKKIMGRESPVSK